jgi:hypothetical protein
MENQLGIQRLQEFTEGVRFGIQSVQISNIFTVQEPQFVLFINVLVLNNATLRDHLNQPFSVCSPPILGFVQDGLAGGGSGAERLGSALHRFKLILQFGHNCMDFGIHIRFTQGQISSGLRHLFGQLGLLSLKFRKMIRVNFGWFGLHPFKDL